MYQWMRIQDNCQTIINQLLADDWRPDYVAGVNPHGLVPALLISQYFDVKLNVLDPGSESNCWMAEDAYGYGGGGSQDDLRKKILIVGGQSGQYLDWIHNDWVGGCMPKDPAWDSVWGHSVRVAVLNHDPSIDTKISVQYFAQILNSEDFKYPWFDWWKQ